MTAARLASLLSAHSSLAGRLGDEAAAAAALDAKLEQAMRKWSRIPADEQAFLADLARRIPPALTVEAALERLHLDDLWLAFACHRPGSSEAIAAFEHTYFGEIRRALARASNLPVDAQDVEQLVREKLFVAAEDRLPRIAEFSGQGPLRLWVRVTVLRLIQNLATRRPKEECASLEGLADAPTPDLDPELLHIRELYRGQFTEAFRDAVSRLSPDARVLLEQRFMERLTQEALAKLYDVHVNTIARWLERAQGALEQEVKRSLSERLRVSDEQLRSIVRLVRSQLDLSFGGRR